jgi:hypothetical protein
MIIDIPKIIEQYLEYRSSDAIYEINAYYNRRIYKTALSITSKDRAVQLIRELLKHEVVCGDIKQKFYHLLTLIKTALHFIRNRIIPGEKFAVAVFGRLEVARKEATEQCAVAIEDGNIYNKIFYKNRVEFVLSTSLDFVGIIPDSNTLERES